MKIEVIFGARKRALQRLVEQHGKVSDFCRQYGLNEDRIRQILSGHRNFAEKSARKMEEDCGLPDFYFDLDVSEVIALVSLFSRLDDRDKEEMRRTAEILARSKS